MSRSVIPDLKMDCLNLVKEFVDLKTTSFSEFVSVWKSRHFDLIFAGQGENEIDYFILHVIHIAKSYCAESKPKLERVAGLYMLYLLYYTEPLKRKKGIRIIPDEYSNLKKFADGFKYENKEVSYAFYKLMLDHAFDFVITPLPYDENLLHFKDDLKSYSQSQFEQSNHKLIVEAIFDNTGFQKTEWSKMVSDYNNDKKKINSSCSLNLGISNDFVLENV